MLSHKFLDSFVTRVHTFVHGFCESFGDFTEFNRELIRFLLAVVVLVLTGVDA
jgi:hypothetical protein